MPILARPLSLAAALTLALGLPALAPALAQEAPAPAAEAPATEAPATGTPPGGELSTGTQALPEGYVKSTHGDWELRCIRANDGSDPCELYQLLKDDKGNSVAEITMVALPEGSKAAAGVTIVAPLLTLLTQQLQLAVDTSKPKLYPYSFCSSSGCFARIGLLPEELEALKKGAKANITIVPAETPDKPVTLAASLKGFTDAFDAVKAENQPPKQ